MKKTIFKFTAGIFVGALLPICVFANEAEGVFKDVGTDHKFKTAIQYLKDKKLIGGYSDGTFKPDASISRAEVVKLIVLADAVLKGAEFDAEIYKSEKVLELTADETLFKFSDISETDWFYPYIYKAYSDGIIKGYDDKSFKPNNKTNRAETLKIILKTFNSADSIVAVSVDPLPDVPFDSWYGPFVALAKEKFLLLTDASGHFNAGNETLRGEFAEILYRQMVIKERNQEKYDPSNEWRFFNRSVEGYTFKIPDDWEESIIKFNDDISATVLWKKDTPNGQNTFLREYPNSASAKIVVNKSTTDKVQFFNKVRELFSTDSLVIETTVNGLPAIVVESKNGNQNIIDAYIFMPNGSTAVIYGTYGNGPLAFENFYSLQKIRENFNYTEKSTIDDSNKKNIVSEARSAIQKDGRGQDILKLFDDLVIIETDTIGVGTGPVDYYFSKKANITIKFERRFNVILDVMNGETSKF